MPMSSDDASATELGDSDWELESDSPDEAGLDGATAEASLDGQAAEDETDNGDPTRGEHYEAWEAEYQAALATLEAGE
jgi:hypothetical protein